MHKDEKPLILLSIKKQICQLEQRRMNTYNASDKVPIDLTKKENRALFDEIIIKAFKEQVSFCAFLFFTQ